MSYQQDLICVRCGAKGTIRKVLLKGLFARGDEYTYFMCTGCKSYGPMWEALTTNAEDFYLMLEEEWEWADAKLLEEESEDITLEDFEKMQKEANDKKSPTVVRIS